MNTSHAPGRIVRATPIVGVAAAIIALHAIGSGPLAAPPTSSIDGVVQWVESGDPVGVSFALLRLAALVIAYHLALTMALALFGRISGRRSLVSMAERLALPVWRGMIRRMVGVGLSTAIGFTAPVTIAAASDPGSPSGLATLRIEAPVEPDLDAGGTATLRLEPASTTSTHDDPEGAEIVDAPAAEPLDPAVIESTSTTGAPSTTADRPTTSSTASVTDGTEHGGVGPSSRLDEFPRPSASSEPTAIPSAGDGTTSIPPLTSTSTRSEVDGTSAPDDGPSSEPEPSESPRSVRTDAESAVGAAVHHVVEPGDHLWALAESRLMSEHARRVTDAEIAPYWRTVIEANPRLADPDLIFPGDVVVLPPTG